MLRFLRKYSSSIGVKILYGLLAALFILWMGGWIGGERRQDVAVVYAQVISHQDLEQATTALTRRYEQLLRGRADLLRGLNLSGQALDQLIQQALLRHEAARLGIAVANAEIDETVKRMPALPQNGPVARHLQAAHPRGAPGPGPVPARVRARYVAYRPADFLSRVEVKDDEVAEYYALHKDDKFTEPEQVRARHILVKTAADAGADAKAAARKKAEELLAKVKAGGDFAALAKERSEDAGSAANGGDLGLFTRGRMTPAFEEAAFALQGGGLSDVVETPFGFHVIKVEEHRPGGAKPLETVHDEIADTLKRERSLALARKQAEEDRRKIARGAPFAEALAGRTIEETPPFAKGAE